MKKEIITLMTIHLPINRSDIEREPNRWLPDIRLDGIEAYRERAQYGNRHVLHIGSNLFASHEDLYNAYNVPAGTINHLAHWAHEKTGINEDVFRLLGWGLVVFGAIKLLKSLK